MRVLSDSEVEKIKKEVEYWKENTGKLWVFLAIGRFKKGCWVDLKKKAIIKRCG